MSDVAEMRAVVRLEMSWPKRLAVYLFSLIAITFVVAVIKGLGWFGADFADWFRGYLSAIPTVWAFKLMSFR